MKYDSISYYDKNSEIYIASTIGVVLDKPIKEFLSLVKKGGHILDFGCGSGRDAKIFKEKGYLVDAIDGSEKMCEAAKAYTSLDVKCMNFEELDEINKYDGVWACSSILHLDRKTLSSVLKKISASLKPSGVFYSSFRLGDGEGEENERYFINLTEEKAKEIFSQSSLEIIKLWIDEDKRLDRENLKWLSILSKKAN